MKSARTDCSHGETFSESQGVAKQFGKDAVSSSSSNSGIIQKDIQIRCGFCCVGVMVGSGVGGGGGLPSRCARIRGLGGDARALRAAAEVS